MSQRGEQTRPASNAQETALRSDVRIGVSPGQSPSASLPIEGANPEQVIQQPFEDAGNESFCPSSSSACNDASNTDTHSDPNAGSRSSSPNNDVMVVKGATQSAAFAAPARDAYYFS